ncbi:MAG: M20/M25/M40 family metallo-hydrolase, partial [Butyricicoccus sp.]
MISIHTDRLLDQFRSLVSLDSPSRGERAVADFLKQAFAAVGVTLHEDAAAGQIGGSCGNLYGYWEGSLPLPPLLFCAHMDTVEPSCGKHMVLHEDGTIMSDGSTVLGADDAAALAVILEALTAIHEHALPHRPIELLFTAAEEPYCVGIQAFDFSTLRSKEAYVFDLTGPVGSAAIQAPTILSFRAEFLGKSAHAGFSPESGIHAIQAAALAAASIPNGRIDDVTVNIGTISGGVANNIVPPSCVFTGEIRSYNDAHALARFEALAQQCRQTAEQLGAQASVTYTRHVTAYCTDETHPVVRRFSSACQRIGLSPQLCATFGGSDNNHLA